jgi:hypothetical protein
MASVGKSATTCESNPAAYASTIDEATLTQFTAQPDEFRAEDLSTAPDIRAVLDARAAGLSADTPTGLHHRVPGVSRPDRALAVDYARLGHQQAVAKGDATSSRYLGAGTRMTTSRTKHEPLVLQVA